MSDKETLLSDTFTFLAYRIIHISSTNNFSKFLKLLLVPCEHHKDMLGTENHGEHFQAGVDSMSDGLFKMYLANKKFPKYKKEMAIVIETYGENYKQEEAFKARMVEALSYVIIEFSETPEMAMWKGDAEGIQDEWCGKLLTHIL